MNAISEAIGRCIGTVEKRVTRFGSDSVANGAWTNQGSSSEDTKIGFSFDKLFFPAFQGARDVQSDSTYKLICLSLDAVANIACTAGAIAAAGWFKSNELLEFSVYSRGIYQAAAASFSTVLATWGKWK
jgi:hypothetical protein